MVTSSPAPVPAANAALRATQQPSDPPDITFRDVLHALNPLQYVPVVGTIYRAVTGDTLPEALRSIGSIVTGGLMGGPVGAAIAAAGSLLQHVTGIDLDRVAHDCLVAMGLVGTHPSPAPVAAVVPSGAGSATAAEGPPAAADPSLRRQALTAYGQTLYTYGPGGGHA